MLPSFKHLGGVILAADDDWTEVVQNLAKAQTVWQRMSRILSREGESPRVYGFFFKAVFQSVLLFSAEMWVVTPRMGRFLGVSKTSCCGNWWGGFYRRGWTESGSITWRRWQYQRQGLSRWKPKFDEVRIWLCSILWRNWFWNYVGRRRGRRGHGWGCSGSNRW